MTEPSEQMSALARLATRTPPPTFAQAARETGLTGAEVIDGALELGLGMYLDDVNMPNGVIDEGSWHVAEIQDLDPGKCYLFLFESQLKHIESSTELEDIDE